LLVYAFIKAGPARRRDSEGPSAGPDPPSPTRHIAGRTWRTPADDVRWWLISYFGPAEQRSRPLRGWWRAAGFIVGATYIVRFTVAMASGDESGLRAARS